MSYSKLSLAALCIVFILGSRVEAFNVTAILGQYSSFSTFNDYLTETQLAAAINGRQTITILAVDNAKMSPLQGQSNDFIKKIMSIHVVLDYYDVQKLQNMSNKTAIFTTLYQSSGLASGQEGFVNCTVLGPQTIAFGSAVRGSNLGSNLVKSIASQPYNISVLQVSSLIMPSVSVGSSNSASNASAPSSPKSPSPSSAPAPESKTSSPSATAPAPSTSASPTSSEAMVPSSEGASPMSSPPQPTSTSPEASPPADAAAPTPSTSEADSPVTSPTKSPGLAPAADGPTADAPSADSGASTNAGFAISLIAVAMSLALASYM